MLQEKNINQINIDTVILVPSLHNGRSITAWHSDRVLRIFFSAPPNYGMVKRSSPISSNDIYGKLKILSNTLSDVIRIQIIDLLSQNSELMTQDIIKHFNIDQPSISRKLKQLVGAGFVSERRSRDGKSNIYTLNDLGIEDACHALDLLKSGFSRNDGNEIVEAPRTHVEQDRKLSDLMRFFNTQARLITWPPSKEKDKILILEHLVSYFEVGQNYSAQEVSDVLRQHLDFQDTGIIRRALNEYNFMQRENDGSSYWRTH
ncbi:DUF2087 domain-containing protein [Ktedonosporobacter rubrisoli]|uniref:DUF2087 domain-containing protein n=1 Tax=Ktedonosporobacter rubrisoli TaxID=2509675 RepID=A0A4P6JPZ4_KTERU|nr:DUF2087 domain-containing protein [Ktedonosporobacter rubrisoli]QBD77230.1 DUF2087 domain-containing protein [Ktedonosporobacter rubrisoli]